MNKARSTLVRRSMVVLLLVVISVGCRFFSMRPLQVLAVDVADPQGLLIEFSAIPDLPRVEAALFLRQRNRAVYGRISRAGTTIRFLPDHPLDPDERYTLTISTRAEDVHGNALERPYIHEFGPDRTLEAFEISAAPAGDREILISFSHPISPHALYEHLSVHPEQRYRIEVADSGVTALIVLLSAPRSDREVSVSIGRGMPAADGRLLGERFTYVLPDSHAEAPPQVISLCVLFPADVSGCAAMSVDSGDPAPVPGLEDFDRDTVFSLRFAVPVYAADLSRVLTISPTVPLHLDLSPGIYVTEVGVRVHSSLDPSTDYVLELAESLRDHHGRTTGHSSFAKLRPAARDYRDPSVAAIQFEGTALSDGGLLDLSAFFPHTEERQGTLHIYLDHAENATVSALEVFRHFRILTWSNSARFRLVSASAEALSPGSTRVRMGLEIIDEAGRFGVVSMQLRDGLSDSLGNLLEREWRIDLNQIGGPSP